VSTGTPPAERSTHDAPATGSGLPADEPAGIDPGIMRPIGRWRPAVFAGIWLVYLVQPISSAFGASGPWRVVAIVALLAFAALFVAGVVMVRAVRRGETRKQRVWAVLIGMSALLALAAPGSGVDVTGGMIYIGVLAVMALPSRPAGAVVVVLAVASEVVPELVPGWEADTFFGFQLLIACFAAWGMMQVIARNAELMKARHEIARLAVADERARLSRDLHDILGHSLTVITVKAELAGRLAEAEGAEQAVREIADVERLAREALADVRSTVGGMRGVTLAGELAGARSALEAAGIRAQVPSAVDDVPVAWRELFAWTVREGVTNVVRHSRAGECTVRLSPRSVEVVDDGSGPPPSGCPRDSAPGHGLAGLGERARQLGARMTVGSAHPEGGFLLRMEVPT
jgi:two-component system sensor histidine kinase DesK